MGKIGEENALRTNSAKVSGITPINKDVVHRICSGQVVLTLAVAVKELLENSVDAGATAIDVRLVDQGSTLVEVADNGSGIKEEDFQGIALKHHTSKLSTFTDLESVNTFGFRGEALSSLCSLCGGLSVITCHSSSGCAASLEFDADGSLIKRKPCARQIGTTVSLHSLFSGLPVRRREFLRHLQREFTKMTHLLYAYCLVSTGIRITCTNQKQGKGSQSAIVVATQGGETFRDNISCVFGHKQLMGLCDFKQNDVTEEILQEFGLKTTGNLDESGSEECEGIQQVEVPSSPFSISGCISTCEHGKGRGAPDRQFFYVNSRPCEPTKVIRLVNEVYHQYNSHQYPFVFMDIKTNGMDGCGVDVNVTPDKRKIFIENEKLLLATVKASLLEMYRSTPSTFKFQNLPVVISVNKTVSCQSEENKPLSIHSLKASSLSPSSSKASTISQALSRFAQSKVAVTEEKNEPKICKRPHGTQNGARSKQPKLNAFMASELRISHSLQVDGGERLEMTKKLTTEDTQPFITQENEEFSESVSQEICAEISNSEIAIEKNVISVLSQSEDGENKNIKMSGTTVANMMEGNTEIKDAGDAFTGKNHNEMVPCQRSDSKTLEYRSINQPGTSAGEGIQSIMRRFSFKVEEQVGIIRLGDSVNAKKRKHIDSDEELLHGSPSKHGTREDNCSDMEVVILDDENVESDKRGIRMIELSVSLADISSKLTKAEERKSKGMKHLAEKKLRFCAGITPKENSSAETELQREITKDMFAKMKIIGQFNLGFLITKLGSDLFIIDQHASDEKYNFETLQLTTDLQQQPLVVPQPLELTAAAKSVLVENIEVFERNGFRFSFHSEEKSEKEERDAKIYLTSIPYSRNWTFGKEDVDELIFMLQDSPHANCRPSRVRDMFASRACRKSVMIGDALNAVDMRHIIDHMGQMDHPWNCPHGRPTMRHLINIDLIATDIT